MKNKKEVNYKLQWDHQGTGDYESGLVFGRKMSNCFLSLMGSGEINIYNVMLPALMAAWNTFYNQANDKDTCLYLDGQHDGFLGRLSEFLVVAAYMNNCALSEENNFNPALIKRPEGLS